MTETIATTIANQIAYYLKKEIQINAVFLDNAFSRTKYNYPWLSETDRKAFQNTHPFTRQAILKEKISCIPNSNQETTEGKWRWVVNEWGGIKKFDVSKRVIECYNKETYNGNVDSYLNDQLCTLSSISSFSKIASFTKPIDWFVYDSRVTYVLDWLLFKYCDKQDVLYFRIPDSYSDRRERMSNHIGENANYFAKRDCYKNYCNLVKMIAEEFMWNQFPFIGDKLSCKIEMILFALGKNGGIIDSEIRQNNSQNQQSAPKPKLKRKSNWKTPSIRNNTRENRELQRLSLKVYDGSGPNFGKTFKIINQSNHSPALSVSLIYQGETIEASTGTYNHGHDTLRGAKTIKRFIDAHQLRPGQLIQCTFENENGRHRYIIETLPEQSE